MLNREKYKDELEDILFKCFAVTKNGNVCECDDIACCDECMFGDEHCYKGKQKWINSECSILDDAEKRYLSGIIRPFRNIVLFIKKDFNCANFQWIEITVSGNKNIVLPAFKNGEMYKGMEAGKEYTLEELGL